MQILQGWAKADEWGSLDAIPTFLGDRANGSPVSEIWFGAHRDGPTLLADGRTLAQFIEEDPRGTLGAGLLYAFGPTLPFLMKIIAPAQTLSLQVHPTKEIAREGYLREEVLGVGRTDAHRSYRDMNHKPEMIYALTDFEALVGFRVPRKARELLDGLECELASKLRHRLQLSTVRGGLRALTAWLMDEDSPATPQAVDEFVEECRARLSTGRSPSVRTDRLVDALGRKHPGDPGIIVAFLMNPVSLRPGEAVHIPPRQIHAYQSGLGIEVMASSDNVIRAGLTGKYVDSAQLVEIAEFSALPPIRVAPEHPSETTDRFLVPAQEFELAVTTLGQADGEVVVPGEGARIVLVVDGDISVRTQDSQLDLQRGDAAFVSASEQKLFARGKGRMLQVAAP
ncbi:mannose-6-phosphate isomerase, class I [Schaalia vaccimaxillae]|uniref:mannose-6-phosphate isomerase, class I n=1 Tax=Schaalia vaccimaxillae TaxID=183916 RepID=UPI0003B71ABB|nr:mannose-6-phosphate isomerase, class I [Schaalia vaccimaxillae]